MEQLWEGRQWDCRDMTQQSTAEGAESPEGRKRGAEHARGDCRGSVVQRNGKYDSVGG